MKRCRGDMASPRHNVVLIITISILAVCSAGPVGYPNVTSSDLGLKEGSCAVGDVVYMPGDEFPGSTACERCTCAAGGVQCSKQTCEPRPGCKALHRPDHCCPTYQCECEQEGRVYGNGEKLVDPADPCRVCYCQGGEVVCRRIACFVRDDCRPRLVPGRCCPEYDNCPLRGVATVPGVAPSISSISTIEDVGASAASNPPKENIKQEITIKEITPVSEIPVITDVKIKEILPSPSIEVAEYSSSKSPLIPREATSEKSVSSEEFSKTETPVVIEIKSPSAPTVLTSQQPGLATSSETFTDAKTTDDTLPSKISLSTQDSINSEIYPSNIPSVATAGSQSSSSDSVPVVITIKAPSVVEEEDTSLFDHNPAFPPLPDDLSVLSNHDDEIIPEQEVNVPPVVLVTEASTVKDILTTTSKYVSESTSTTAQSVETTFGTSTIHKSSTSTDTSKVKESPMLNLRSAIPTEILNIPSAVPEEITGEDDAEEIYSTTSKQQIDNARTTETIQKIEEINYQPESHLEPANTAIVTEADTTTHKVTEAIDLPSSQIAQEQTTSSIAKSNFATEVTSQTELSSLPIETSNQRPSEVTDNVSKDRITVSTVADSITVEDFTTRTSPTESDLIVVSKENPTDTGTSIADETTEFTSFGSPEVVTDTEPVELIKAISESEKNAAIVQSSGEKNSVLKDLIKLVGDVASISDHTDAPDTVRRTTSASISDSEELIPVNAGYKSKNNNWNLNSITEIPFKSKNPTQNKQKMVEIEDEGESVITDSPPPNDKVEPTTRRPIIDNVSNDNMPENKTEKKDIEIITQSYVPTINRRPSKVVMKERVVTAESIEGGSVSTTTDTTTVAVVSKETATTEVPTTKETVSTQEVLVSKKGLPITESFKEATTTSRILSSKGAVSTDVLSPKEVTAATEILTSKEAVVSTEASAFKDVTSATAEK